MATRSAVMTEIPAVLFRYLSSVGLCQEVIFSKPALIMYVCVFLPRDALVHSAVLRLHVVRPSVRPSVRLSVCNVGGSGSHRLEILETNCTDT